MQNFIVCFNAVMPIFLSLSIGFIARRCGMLTREDIEKFNKIAFEVFMPAMVFANIYNSDVSSAIRPQVLIFAALGVIASFLTAAFIGYKLVRLPQRRGVVIQGVCRSNFVIIGMPIALSLISDSDMGVVAVLLAVIIPIFNVFAVVILSLNNGKKPELKKTLLNITKNPLILGTASGLLVSLSGLRLPHAAEKVITDFSYVASPLMLFLLGAFFEFDNLSHAKKELFGAVLGRLIVLPGIMLTLGYALGFKGLEFVALIGIFASPTAVASFPMAQQMGGDARLAGNIVVMTSAFCSFTLFIWCFLFKTLGAF